MSNLVAIKPITSSNESRLEPVCLSFFFSFLSALLHSFLWLTRLKIALRPLLEAHHDFELSCNEFRNSSYHHFIHLVIVGTPGLSVLLSSRFSCSVYNFISPLLYRLFKKKKKKFLIAVAGLLLFPFLEMLDNNKPIIVIAFTQQPSSILDGSNKSSHDA